ncbi:MAG: HD domain-containing protein [Eubacteriales bacterium]
MLRKYEAEYDRCVNDLLESDIVLQMNDYIQHGEVTTLDHCKNVSYISFLICRRLGLDSRAAARGGLLHDFFLYDWHKTSEIKDAAGHIYKGLHGYVHPYVALANAEYYFGAAIGGCEREIIRTHMWPLTLSMPRCREAYAVILADKLAAGAEVLSAIVHIPLKMPAR